MIRCACFERINNLHVIDRGSNGHFENATVDPIAVRRRQISVAIDLYAGKCIRRWREKFNRRVRIRRARDGNGGGKLATVCGVSNCHLRC